MMRDAQASKRDDDVRRQNRARLDDLAARVRAASVTESQLCRDRGLTTHDLKDACATGRILGVQVPLSSETRFPLWQFRLDGSVHPRLPELVASARAAHLSPLQLHELVTSPASGIGGRPLAELLDDQPREVLAIVEAAGDVGA